MTPAALAAAARELRCFVRPHPHDICKRIAADCALDRIPWLGCVHVCRPGDCGCYTATSRMCKADRKRYRRGRRERDPVCVEALADRLVGSENPRRF